MTLRSRSRTWKFCVKAFGLSVYKSISLEVIDEGGGAGPFSVTCDIGLS